MSISSFGEPFNAIDNQPRMARIIRSGGAQNEELVLSEVVYVLAVLQGAQEDGRPLFLVVEPRPAATPYLVEFVRYGNG